MTNTKPSIDFSSELKSISNLPNLNRTYSTSNSNLNKLGKTDLIVKDFYLELFDFKNHLFNNTIKIRKNSIDSTSLTKIKSLIDKKCIGCLIKIAKQWYKVKISLDNKDFILIKLIQKVNSLKELNSIHYLLNTIKKLKFKMVPKPIVEKYISNYLEYNAISS